MSAPHVSVTECRVAPKGEPRRPGQSRAGSTGRSGQAGLGLLRGDRDAPPADPVPAPPFRLSLPRGQPRAEGPFVGTAQPTSKLPGGRVTRTARRWRLWGCSGDAEPGLGGTGCRGTMGTVGWPLDTGLSTSEEWPWRLQTRSRQTQMSSGSAPSAARVAAPVLPGALTSLSRASGAGAGAGRLLPPSGHHRVPAWRGHQRPRWASRRPSVTRGPTEPAIPWAPEWETRLPGELPLPHGHPGGPAPVPFPSTTRPVAPFPRQRPSPRRPAPKGDIGPGSHKAPMGHAQLLQALALGRQHPNFKRGVGGPAAGRGRCRPGTLGGLLPLQPGCPKCSLTSEPQRPWKGPANCCPQRLSPQPHQHGSTAAVLMGVRWCLTGFDSHFLLTRDAEPHSLGSLAIPGTFSGEMSVLVLCLFFD